MRRCARRCRTTPWRRATGSRRTAANAASRPRSRKSLRWTPWLKSSAHNCIGLGAPVPPAVSQDCKLPTILPKIFENAGRSGGAFAPFGDRNVVAIIGQDHQRTAIGVLVGLLEREGVVPDRRLPALELRGEILPAFEICLREKGAVDLLQPLVHRGRGQRVDGVDDHLRVALRAAEQRDQRLDGTDRLNRGVEALQDLDRASDGAQQTAGILILRRHRVQHTAAGCAAVCAGMHRLRVMCLAFVMRFVLVRHGGCLPDRGRRAGSPAAPSR